MLGQDQHLIRTRVLAPLAALLLGSLALLGCTPVTSVTSPPSTTPVSPVTSPPSSTTAVTTTPLIGACYALTAGDLDSPTSSVPPVACSEPHTAETVAVLLHRNLTKVESITADCSKAVRRHIGATPLQLATTMVRAVWFLPSSPSADWVRCDMVLLQSAGTLAPLPTNTQRVWKRAPDSIRVCGTKEPGAKGFERVLCATTAQWRVLVALPLAQTTYPGAKELRIEGSNRCSDAVRKAKHLVLKYSYGFEWPTKDQWHAGQHYLLCWSKG